uniref:GOLD domain-containing protein n=1 Tax=Macrostomum lignano TaxID=282301 RepID=A0A1I8IGI3_9PLAT
MQLRILTGLAITLSHLLLVASSTAEVFEDEKTGEIILSVTSSQPETSFYGGLGFTNLNWGIRNTLKRSFAAGEEFCLYSPVLGMRNLTVFIFAEKYWDSDAEFELLDSEGVTLESKQMTTEGNRMPTARVNVYQLCVRNRGSAKTIFIGLHQSQRSKIIELTSLLNNMTAEYTMTVEVMSRIEYRIASLEELAKTEYSIVIQDFFRLKNIRSWVMYRSIGVSLGMLLSSAMSTMIIRRWFNSSRSNMTLHRAARQALTSDECRTFKAALRAFRETSTTEQ